MIGLRRSIGWKARPLLSIRYGSEDDGAPAKARMSSGKASLAKALMAMPWQNLVFQQGNQGSTADNSTMKKQIDPTIKAHLIEPLRRELARTNPRAFRLRWIDFSPGSPELRRRRLKAMAKAAEGDGELVAEGAGISARKVSEIAVNALRSHSGGRSALDASLNENRFVIFLSPLSKSAVQISLKNARKVLTFLRPPDYKRVPF